MPVKNIDLKIKNSIPNTIPFHVPTYAGEEVINLSQAISDGKWSEISKESILFFKNYYPESHCFLTNSCSSALEMAIRALDIGEGDEVIIPGYGYVALANAVVNNGARPVFADVQIPDGNITLESVAACISPCTKAVIALHYAGNPLDIISLLQLCNKHRIYLIEDAAQCLGSGFNGKPLGSFGHIACLSFDYMKNISCGQGGLLIINDLTLLSKIQVTYDNGTNRQALLDGTENEFSWVDKGNNFQINPIASYFLAEQLKAMPKITEERIGKWDLYYKLLLPLERIGKIVLPNPVATHNGHIFFVITASKAERTELRAYLRKCGILSEQHYSSLAHSVFGRQFADLNVSLQNSELLCSQLLRLPLWNRICEEDIQTVAAAIKSFYNQND